MRDMTPQDSNPERLGGGAGEEPQARRRGFDYLIVGAGFAGSVLAERLARGLNKRVLVVDRRPHIAGNAYDYHDESGVLIHRYGPHIFHTNAQRIVAYLSQFTEWRPYEHRALAQVDGTPTAEGLELAARIVGRYCKGRNEDTVTIQIDFKDGQGQVIETTPYPIDDIPKEWHV